MMTFSCGTQEENVVPTQNITKILLCLCGPTNLYEIHMFQEHFLSFTATEKVEFTKEATQAKLQPFFVNVTTIVLMQQICILELSNQVLKLLFFKDLE